MNNNQIYDQGNKIKKRSVVLPVVLLAVGALASLAVVLILLMWGAGGYSSEVKEQLALAERYLDELDYEKAVAAYKAAIELDPKCEEAYAGLAEAAGKLADEYMEKGEEEKAQELLEETAEILGDGYLETGEESIYEKSEEFREKIAEIVVKKDEEPEQDEDGGKDVTGDEDEAGGNGDGPGDSDKSGGDSYADIYAKYLEFLEGHKEECTIYSQLYEDDHLRPAISFCDVAGDEAPEMLYLSCEWTEWGYYSKIHIAEVRGGLMTELAEFDGHIDGVGHGGGHYLFFLVNDEKAIYGLSQDYYYMCYVRISENGSGKMEMKELFSQSRDFGTPQFSYYDHSKSASISKDAFLEKRKALSDRETEIIYDCGHCSWSEYDGDSVEEFRTGHKNIGMTYDEAVAWLKKKCGAGNAEPAQDAQGPLAEVEFEWDISTVTIFDVQYGDGFPSADECDLHVISEVPASFTQKAVNGGYEYRDAAGKLILEEKTEQTGNKKKYSCKLYSFEYDLDIIAEPVSLVPGLPGYPLGAVIRYDDGRKVELTAEDMQRRGQTGFWYFGICSVSGGQLDVY